MAKATLEVPFSSISGRLSGESEMYVTTRFGETVISTYPKHRDPKKITAHQHALNANFAQAVAQAKVELSDPIRRAYWQDRFTRYQRRGFRAFCTYCPPLQDPPWLPHRPTNKTTLW